MALAAGAQGQERILPRYGVCEAAMTVVRAGCGVENLFVCENGSHYHESLLPDGTVGAELSDPDYSLIYSVDVESGEGVQGIIEVRRALSLSELLATGASVGDYTVALVMGPTAARPARSTFDLRLTGETRSIGSVLFRVATARLGLGVGSGGEMAEANGFVLIDPARGLLITDASTMTFDGESHPSGEPVTDIILSGRPGFMPEEAPLCEDALSLATPSPEPPHG